MGLIGNCPWIWNRELLYTMVFPRNGRSVGSTANHWNLNRIVAYIFY